jgi:HPt (histidine-containing phosphotransfer) domain-containing protein
VRQACEELNEISLDLKELFIRVEYDRELLDEIFDIFKSEFPRLQQSLREAVDCHDMEQVQVNAHALRGMLASISFRAASAAAMRLERLARSADLAGLPAEMARMEHDALASQADLEQFCARAAR